MLKIAVVTRYFPSSAEPWQGRSAYQTLRVLARRSEVHVFYPNAAYPSLLKPRSRNYDRLDAAFSPPDVAASYYDFPALPLISRPFNGGMAARALLPHVRAFAPDLILSFFLYPDGYAALQIGKALSVPVVAMSIGSDINRIGDPLSARHTRSVLRKADFLLAVSDDLRQKAVAMGAPVEKTRALINGCDLSVFHPRDRVTARQQLGIPLEAEMVLYLGRMDLKKGLRELIEAATALHPQRSRMHVYLVGAGPDRALLEALIHAKGADSYIYLIPNCAPDEVAVWMAATNLVTLPSYMEGCPNVVLEALACGRPVVATHVGGIPEITSDASGRLVPPRDPAALGRALATVLDAEWDAQELSNRGSRSWETVAAELWEVFSSLLASRQSDKNVKCTE
jgi:glycosyltransferase involved in cell wall biosynthesis